MTGPTAPARVSALQAILAWSVKRPAWQRDALRRIVTADHDLPSDDVDELDRLCRSEHGALEAGEPVPKAEPLTAVHLPQMASGEAVVSLVSLGNLRNVNRLPEDQTLTFGATPGLTVIYGENGSGKSGYARVIKRACRAREQASLILPDLLATAQSTKTSAQFVIHKGAQDLTIAWEEGMPADPRLRQVFLFDSVCAEHYVAKDDGVAFTPFGLEVLDGLSALADTLRKRLSDRHDALKTEIDVIAKQWTVRPSTTVGKILAQLGAGTKESEILAASTWTDTHVQRLSLVRAALGSDPKAKAASAQAAAQRIQTFRLALQAAARHLDDTAITALRTALARADRAKKAAEALAVGTFDESFLAGTGSSTWKTLWDAAREYSTRSAYPGSDFPVLGEGARCVLCQTTLAGEARARLKRFDVYVSDAVGRMANQQAKAATEMVKELAALPWLRDEQAKIVADLATAADEVRTAVAVFVRAADTLLEELQNAASRGNWDKLSRLPAPPDAALQKLEDSLHRTAEALAAADDPTERMKLVDEQMDLEDRQWLAAAKDEALRQVKRHQSAARLRRCINDTQTTQITQKATELTKVLVTESFRKSFAGEVTALGGRKLPVHLGPTGSRKGVSLFGVRLAGRAEANLPSVASEGEKRRVALALFLAELAQASDESALVLDDPSSSLDHQYRNSMALRLVKEARSRQVIIFTHDLAFVCDLQTAAEEASLPIAARFLDWQADRPGFCAEGLPWRWQSAKEQMKTLRELYGQADKLRRETREAAYNSFAVEVCGKIRAACERVVENVLFNQVVHRHDGHIAMGRLVSVAAVGRDDYDAVHAIWKDCSNLIEAHAASWSNPPVVPQPDKLKEMVACLEKVIEDVKQRRQTDASSAGPVPVAGSSDVRMMGPSNGRAPGIKPGPPDVT